MAQILIADDDTSSCHIFGDLLRMLGHGATCVFDGKAALEQIQSSTPDLLILDVMMPEMDGWQVLEHLHSGINTRGIAVVMYSAVADAESKKRAADLGARDYWVKASFDFRTTQNRINDVLKSAQPQAMSA
jgi:CheY-like chemotaxis protein